jgi:hypothetical protein
MVEKKVEMMVDEKVALTVVNWVYSKAWTMVVLKVEHWVEMLVASMAAWLGSLTAAWLDDKMGN